MKRRWFLKQKIKHHLQLYLFRIKSNKKTEASLEVFAVSIHAVKQTSPVGLGGITILPNLHLRVFVFFEWRHLLLCVRFFSPILVSVSSPLNTPELTINESNPHFCSGMQRAGDDLQSLRSCSARPFCRRERSSGRTPPCSPRGPHLPSGARAPS